MTARGSPEFWISGLLRASHFSQSNRFTMTSHDMHARKASTDFHSMSLFWIRQVWPKLFRWVSIIIVVIVCCTNGKKPNGRSGKDCQEKTPAPVAWSCGLWAHLSFVLDAMGQSMDSWWWSETWRLQEWWLIMTVKLCFSFSFFIFWFWSLTEEVGGNDDLYQQRLWVRRPEHRTDEETGALLNEAAKRSNL